MKNIQRPITGNRQPIVLKTAYIALFFILLAVFANICAVRFNSTIRITSSRSQQSCREEEGETTGGMAPAKSATESLQYIVSSGLWVPLNETETFLSQIKACNIDILQHMSMTTRLDSSVVGEQMLGSVLELWGNTVARGVPGSWVEVGSNNTGLSLLAAEVLRAGLESNKCTSKLKRTIQVSMVEEEENDASTAVGGLLDRFHTSPFSHIKHTFQSRGFESGHLGNAVHVAFWEGQYNETIQVPNGPVAVLTLNTCQYQSTVNTLITLYPRLIDGGYIILNNYTSCNQCAQAVKEYLQNLLGYLPPVNKIDSDSVWFQKPVVAAADFTSVGRLIMHAGSELASRFEADKNVTAVSHYMDSYLEVLALYRAASYQGVQHICEIGFHAGFRAIAMLASNPAATMTAFGSGDTPWSNGMVGFVTNLFPDRFHYIPGNYSMTIPDYALRTETGDASQCDLTVLGVDASYNEINTDMLNVIKATARFIIIMNYSDSSPGVMKAWDELVATPNVDEIHCQSTEDDSQNMKRGWCVGQILTKNEVSKPRRDIHVIVSQCGNQTVHILELEVMIKSMLLSSDPSDYINLHLVMDLSAIGAVKDRIVLLTTDRLILHFYEKNLENMADLFRPCSTQSLVSAEVVNDVDCAIYLDRDTLIINSLWEFYQVACSLGDKFVGLSREGGGFYLKNHGIQKAGFTYVPDTGVNGGILAMNLKLMRNLGFAAKLMRMYELYNKLGYRFNLGDQDMLNLYFAQNPKHLKIMTCRYNTRIVGSKCDCCHSSVLEDAIVLHGNNKAFQREGVVVSDIWNKYLRVVARFYGAPLVCRAPVIA